MSAGEGGEAESKMGAVEPRWRMAFVAATLNALQVGTFFMAPTTLMPLILAEFDAEVALAPVPISVGKLSYVIFLLPGGMFVDYFGPKRSLVLGFCLLAVMSTIYAFLLSDFVQTIFIHVGMAMAASVCGVPVYAVLVAQWFSESLGVAMGLVLAGFSLSGVLTPILLAALASKFSWRTAFGIMSGLLWFAALPLAQLVVQEKRSNVLDIDAVAPTVRPDPKDNELEKDGPNFGLFDDEDDPYLSWRQDMEQARTEPEEEPRPDTPLLGPTPEKVSKRPVPWRTMPFWMLVASYVLMQFSYGSLAENMLLMFTLDAKLPLLQATSIFATLNFASMTAKLVGGRLGDSFDRFRVAIVTSSLTALGMTFFFIGPSDPLSASMITNWTPMYFGFALIFGFGYGSTFNALYTLPPVLFGSESLGKVQSTLFAAGLTGNATGAVVTGIFRSNFGTYDLAFALLFILASVNVGVLFFLERTEEARDVRRAKESDSTETAVEPAQTDTPTKPIGMVRRSNTFADIRDAGLLSASLEFSTVDANFVRQSLWPYFEGHGGVIFGEEESRAKRLPRLDSEPVLRAPARPRHNLPRLESEPMISSRR